LGIGIRSPYLRNHPRVWHDAVMGISQKLLSDGEHVVLSVRTHGKALIAPVATLILVVAGVLTVAMLQPDNSVWGLAAAVVAVPVLIIWSFIPFLRWTTSTYTVTNRRLITRRGIITRTGRDIPLFRINDVAYEKGLLDRILGCGTLIISDATEKAGVVLPDVPNVEQVHLRISDLLFANDDGTDDDGSRVPGEPPRNNQP
jgi:membrane protein YdbS with pleckstrin-like domain